MSRRPQTVCAALVAELVLSGRVGAQPLGESGLAPARQHTETANSPRLELEHWRLQDVPAANPGVIIDQPALSGMPIEPVRRNAAFKLAGGGTVWVCPSGVSTCRSQAGAFLALTGLHRVEPWFAWGGSLEGLSLGQTWLQGDDALALTHNIVAGRILAQLHPLSEHLLDPYFGIGLGMGVVETHATASDSIGVRQSRTLIQTASTWTPFYAIHFGVDMQLTENIKLGAVADWSNYQALTGENCAWKTFGACSSTAWGAFSTDNAIWKAGMALSFAFGEEL